MFHDILADPLAVRTRWYPKLTVGILFDLRTDPRTTHIKTNDGRIVDAFQPATAYPTSYLRILIRPTQHLELPIDVTCHAYVSIGQVLWALHNKLLQPITHHEWHKLSRREQRRVAEAFYERVNKSSYPSYEQSIGLRGIDLLCGDTKFHGLEPSSRGKHVWKLVFRREDAPSQYIR